MVMEENLAKWYILQVFQTVIGFLLHNAGLIRFLFSKFAAVLNHDYAFI